MSVIKIVNKHWHKSTADDVYAGRGSPFGNPYSHLPNSKAEFKVATREEAIEKYLPWFEKQRMNDAVLYQGLQHLIHIVANNKDLNLVCYCAPADCHCRHIKNYLEDVLRDIKIQETNGIG